MPKVIVISSSQLAELDPRESGFAHGFGVFETMKLAAGRLYLFKAHWHRLMCSADALGIECEATAAEAFEAIRELVKVDGLLNAVIKLSLLRDRGGAKLFVYSRPSHACPESIALQLRADAPINERGVLAGHKTHNYMENLALLLEAKAKGYTDVLRVNAAGALAETTVGNFFFIQEGKLCTPSLRCGVLPGTRRDAVLQLADQMKLEIAEREFRIETLKTIEAAFVTNASVGVLPVHRIEGEGVLYESTQQHEQIAALSNVLSDYESEHRIDV